MTPIEIIISGSRKLGIEVTREAAAKMLQHLDMVIEWRNKAGLTSIDQPKQMAVYHFLDSLTLFKIVPRGTLFSLLDVGTGAGFPGMVMIEANPSLLVTLLDQNPRKIVFLKLLSRKLGLENVRFLNRKVESLFSRKNDLMFDYVVSRAFSSRGAQIESLASLLKPDGGLIHMGGPSTGRDGFKPAGMVESDRWEGVIPYSDIRRIVTVYRRTPNGD